MKQAIIVHWTQYCVFNIKVLSRSTVCELNLKFPSLSTAFKRMQRQLQTNEREKDLLSQCKQVSQKDKGAIPTANENSEYANTPTYSWSNVSRLGCTFRLLHVAQHSGLSFIQHILQKHHLTTPGFHTPHQSEGHVLTPENTGEFSIRLNKTH